MGAAIVRRLLLLGLLLAWASPASAGITYTQRIHEHDTANTTSYTTATTWSFASTSVGVCFVANTDATPTTDTTPTMTQTGYTWTYIGSMTAFSTVASPTISLHAFRAIGTGAAAAAVVTAYGADGQTSNSIDCWELTGVDLGGTNGANAIPQKVNATPSDSATSTTVTLAALAGASSGVMQFACVPNQARTWTPDTEFQIAANEVIGSGAPNIQCITQFPSTFNHADGAISDTTPTLTVSGAALAIDSIAIEVKAAAVTTTCGALGLLGVGCLP